MKVWLYIHTKLMLQFESQPIKAHSLFALMGLGLRHRLCENLIKVATAQWHVSVVGDQRVEAVK